MREMLARLAFSAVALIVSALPVAAQQIAADFAQIDDCAGVNRFASRHSGNPVYRTYSGQLANLRRTYCRPRNQAGATAPVRQAPGRHGTARPARAAPSRRPQTNVAGSAPAVRRPAAPSTRPATSAASRAATRAVARAPGRPLVRTPAPQQAQARYMSPLEVANLYRDHYLCYEYSANGTCGAYEASTGSAIGAGGMRLVQRYGYSIAEHLRAPLSLGAPFLAEAVLVTGVQNVSFDGNALCRRRNQRVLDAYETEYHLQEHAAAGPRTRMEEVSPAVLERMREDDAKAESETPAILICSRYRRDPAASGTQIIEEAYFDGTLRSTATIRLLPRRQGLPPLHW
jgi:hypothetical protein